MLIVSVAGVKTGVNCPAPDTAISPGIDERPAIYGVIITRMGGRVVECTSLENWRTFARTVGSNPTPSV